MDAPTSDMNELSLDQLVELERRAAEREASTGGGGSDADDGGTGRGAGGETIVLPWWQHPVNIITMVVTAAILAAMVGWMVGNTNEVPHNDVDTGFLQDMRVHHEQAVYMSFVFRELPDTDPGLRTIAGSIAQGQSLEVGRMIQLLRSFGETEANESGVSMLWMGMSADSTGMPGMASEAELEQLVASSGREADELFVRLMNAHHTGGIEMAEFAAANAENSEVTKMAAAMASAQRSEIVEMNGRLDR